MVPDHVLGPLATNPLCRAGTGSVQGPTLEGLRNPAWWEPMKTLDPQWTN